MPVIPANLCSNEIFRLFSSYYLLLLALAELIVGNRRSFYSTLSFERSFRKYVLRVEEKLAEIYLSDHPPGYFQYVESVRRSD